MDYRSAVNPWEYEFKGSKLVRKKPRGQPRRRGEKKKKEDEGIDFMEMVMLDRRVLRVKDRRIEEAKGGYEDRFAAPKN